MNQCVQDNCCALFMVAPTNVDEPPSQRLQLFSNMCGGGDAEGTTMSSAAQKLSCTRRLAGSWSRPLRTAS